MQISRSAVYAAAAVFLALFGAVFFLLGRESTRRRSAAMASGSAPAPIAESSPVGAAAPIAQRAAATTAAPMQPAAQPMPTSTVGQVPAVAPASQDGAPERVPAIEMAAMPPLADPPAVADGRSAARDYFSRMQAIQTVASTNDTSEFANKLLAASMTGDSSGFDDLIKVMKEGAARARAIAPPPCCVDYHQRLLGMIAESARMVEQLKDAIGKNDSTALTALAASAGTLQTRANALEEEATQIKARLGLGR
jgi:hypothetical protein